MVLIKWALELDGVKMRLDGEKMGLYFGFGSDAISWLHGIDVVKMGLGFDYVEMRLSLR